MRGVEETSGSLFSYVDLEARIPARHPLRKIRQVVNEALASLNAEFEAIYVVNGLQDIRGGLSGGEQDQNQVKCGAHARIALTSRQGLYL